MKMMQIFNFYRYTQITPQNFYSTLHYHKPTKMFPHHTHTPLPESGIIYH